MKTRGIHLQYTFGPPDQRGADIGNPLFDLLSAVHECGSIQHAARSLGASYRHVWGALKQWEEALGEPLVTWAQGQPARLTPFADRLIDRMEEDGYISAPNHIGRREVLRDRNGEPI